MRTDTAVEAALETLTALGVSRSEAARQAILDAAKAKRRAALREEAMMLSEDPEDVEESKRLAAEMESARAWLYLSSQGPNSPHGS